MADSMTSPKQNARVVLTFTGRGILDGDVGKLVYEEILRSGCTELDLSENLLTQRGASVLSNCLHLDDVRQSYHRLTAFIKSNSL